MHIRRLHGYLSVYPSCCTPRRAFPPAKIIPHSFLTYFFSFHGYFLFSISMFTLSSFSSVLPHPYISFPYLNYHHLAFLPNSSLISSRLALVCSPSFPLSLYCLICVITAASFTPMSCCLPAVLSCMFFFFFLPFPCDFCFPFLCCFPEVLSCLFLFFFSFSLLLFFPFLYSFFFLPSLCLSIYVPPLPFFLIFFFVHFSHSRLVLCDFFCTALRFPFSFSFFSS